MATQLQPKPDKRPALRVVPADSSIDVRLWARHYVATLLEIEGVTVTPTAIADAS